MSGRRLTITSFFFYFPLFSDTVQSVAVAMNTGAGQKASCFAATKMRVQIVLLQESFQFGVIRLLNLPLRATSTVPAIPLVMCVYANDVLVVTQSLRSTLLLEMTGAVIKETVMYARVISIAASSRRRRAS